jgi:hypothetical protein
MPDSLQPFTILQHKTLAEANATADRERSKFCLCKGPTLTFVGTGTLPSRSPEPSSSESSSSDEDLTSKGKTGDEVPKGDTGVVTSLETEFFGLRGGAQLH